MTLSRRLHTFAALSAALLGLAGSAARASANSYELTGTVYFTNLRDGVNAGALVPYIGYGYSKQLGWTVQTGSIRNLTGLIPVDATTFRFLGEVGPNPYMPNRPEVHLVATEKGNLFCTWTAEFTLQFINANEAIFSGDGAFLVRGGNSHYRRASGHFRTLFRSGPVPAGANDASARVLQYGTIKK